MATKSFNLSSAVSGFALGAVVTLLAAVAVVPANSDRGDDRILADAGGVEADDDVVGEGGDAAAGGASTGGSSSAAGGQAGSRQSASGGASGASAAAEGLECKAGKNGGATDTGVTANSIQLGATVAESGIAEAFLGGVRTAMDAVVNKVNRSGGVCGRLLKVSYKDDGWDSQTGFRYLQDLVEAKKVFALAVVPSSEGLDKAATQGYLDRQKIPVVGSDGMIRSQYNSAYIWPVAAATTTTMHVIAKDAWDRGARRFAIVYENTYRFGVEGAFAFNQAFKRLSGRDIDGYKDPLSGGGGGCEQNSLFCGIPAGQGQYQNQVGIINNACNSRGCDFMVLLLEPKTAQDWMAVPGVKSAGDFARGMAGAQPLFTYDFGRNCGDRCAGMRLWTGYNPPIEQFAQTPAGSTYVSDLHSENAQADQFNQFTEGGYVGMELLVEALKKVGPKLTRAALKNVLDGMSLDTGLTPKPLSWKPGAHYANQAAQAFEIQAKNGFTGWRFVQPAITDPWLGQDAG